MLPILIFSQEQKGQALTELTLALPLLCILFIGIYYLLFLSQENVAGKSQQHQALYQSYRQAEGLSVVATAIHDPNREIPLIENEESSWFDLNPSPTNITQKVKPLFIKPYQYFFRGHTTPESLTRQAFIYSDPDTNVGFVATLIALGMALGLADNNQSSSSASFSGIDMDSQQKEMSGHFETVQLNMEKDSDTISENHPN